MEETSTENQGDNPKQVPRKKTRIRKLIIILLLLFPFLIFLALYINNNYSVTSDADFGHHLDNALQRSADWVFTHEGEILEGRNIALFRMLQDIDTLPEKPVFARFTENFMAMPARPKCWKRLLDPDYPVNAWELNRAIASEIIDNKWTLYALAPDKAELSEEVKDGLFDGEHWQNRQLTHQLWALIHLQRSLGDTDDHVDLIEHLCERLTKQLQWDMPVVDIYIQKIAFVLKAGHPEMINRRWIERVIANQKEDGGWNDRWLCFESRKRPLMNLDDPPSDPHATIQALWLLYQVKYRYPEYFGLAENK